MQIYVQICWIFIYILLEIEKTQINFKDKIRKVFSVKVFIIKDSYFSLHYRLYNKINSFQRCIPKNSPMIPQKGQRRLHSVLETSNLEQKISFKEIRIRSPHHSSYTFISSSGAKSTTKSTIIDKIHMLTLRKLRKRNSLVIPSSIT